MVGRACNNWQAEQKRTAFLVTEALQGERKSNSKDVGDAPALAFADKADRKDLADKVDRKELALYVETSALVGLVDRPALELVLSLPQARERILDWQPTGPNPLYHRDDFSGPALRHGNLNSPLQVA